MKLPSLRALLLAAVGVALIANLGRWIFAPAEEDVEGREESLIAAQAGPEGENIFPSFSNLPAMAEQWQIRMSRMPAAERQKAEERLREEAVFFIQSQSLPPEERREAMRQRLEALMNDPGIQAEWAEERFVMISKMEPTKRQKLFKRYVQYKSKAASR